MEFNTHVMQALYPQEQVRKRRNMTWQFVQEDVLARIQNGTWPAGELIPTETELAAEYGCARATVNRALQVLADSGILERRRKVGTRVVAHPNVQAVRFLLRREIEAIGKVYGYRKLHDDLMDMGETCCPNRVARLAQIAGIRAQIGYRSAPASMAASRRWSSTTRSIARSTSSRAGRSDPA